MKVKDNGQFKPLYIKALDSMPVGTEVDFDGQASNIPVGWEQVEDKGEVYSTTETRVGTWVDGKPLYRKVVYYTGSLSTNLVDIPHNVANMGNYSVIKSANFYLNTSTSTIDGFNGYVNGTDFIMPLEINQTNIKITIGNGWLNTFDKAYFVIEYTKTTD